MKSGFILIEMLIGTAVAAIMSVLLLAAFYQTNRFQIAIDRTIDTTVRVSMLQYYMERDIRGAFIPVMDQIVTDTHSPQNMQNEKAPQQPQSTAQPPAVEEKKNLDKPFYGINKDGHLDLLTMITSNPLITYWDEKAGSSKARIARVTYTVEPSKENKNSYILYRTESQTIEWRDVRKSEENKQDRKYELVRDIKELVVEYELPEEKKENPNQGVKLENKKAEITYAVLPEWQGLSKDAAGEKKPEHTAELPEYVRISVRFWMPGDRESSLFKNICKIMAFKVGDAEKKDQEGKSPKSAASLPKSIDKK